MEEDEFNLSVADLAVLDEVDEQYRRNNLSTSSSESGEQQPTQTQSDFLNGLSNTQWNALDRSIIPNAGRTEHIDSTADELFGNISDDQFAAFDEVIDVLRNSSQSSHGDENNNFHITTSQIELAMAAVNEEDRENEIVQNDENIGTETQFERAMAALDTENQEVVADSQIRQLAMAVFDDNESEPTLEHLQCLRTKFNHSHFRGRQWDIIDAVMNQKRDVCAVMATGYGKSLCFQFPAVYKNKMVLVISPLISLMVSQVFALENMGIRACYVGSAQKDENILFRIQRGDFIIVYSSPEYLQTDAGISMLHSLKERIILIAIDESHCVSNWGFDFRPDYRRLNILRSMIPNTPILALTATATANVRYDIRTSLGLINPLEVSSSFDRPNLEYSVHEKTSIWNDLKKWVTNVNGSVIVYVLKRVETEEIAELLRNHGVLCAHYHAGMPTEFREMVLVDFLKNKFNVIVATTAFGMGIDKKDIRTVVHYGSAKNLEHYYQEVGRAGRDGLPSKVITYFELSDFDIHDWFLEKEDDPEKKKLSNFVKKYLRDLGLSIREYMHTTKCRRKMILEYFGEDTSTLVVRSDCCDNCASGLSQWRDDDLYWNSSNGLYCFKKDARILLEAIQEMEARNVYTDRKKIIQVLIGKSHWELIRLKAHGLGKTRAPYYWKALIDQLTYHDYIEFVAGGSQLKISSEARKFLNGNTSLKQKPVGAMYRFFKKKPNTPISNRVWSQKYKDDQPFTVVKYNGSNGQHHHDDCQCVICLMFGPCAFCG